MSPAPRTARAWKVMKATSPRATARPRRAPSSTSQFSPGSCTSMRKAREKPGPSTSTTLDVGPGRRDAERRQRIAGDERKPGRLRVRRRAATQPIATAASPRRQPRDMRLEYRHMRRRTFVQRALETGLVAPLGARRRGRGGPARAAACSRAADAATTVLARDGVAERAAWVAQATRIADPVLTHLAAGTLKRSMPVEQAAGANRAPVTHLEALGRLLAGLAPWLALPAADTAEGRARARAPRSRAPCDRAGGRSGLARRAELHHRRPAAGRRRVPGARDPPRAGRARRRPRCRRRAPGSSPRSPRRG